MVCKFSTSSYVIQKVCYRPQWCASSPHRPMLFRRPATVLHIVLCYSEGLLLATTQGDHIWPGFLSICWPTLSYDKTGKLCYRLVVLSAMVLQISLKKHFRAVLTPTKHTSSLEGCLQSTQACVYTIVGTPANGQTCVHIIVGTLHSPATSSRNNLLLLGGSYQVIWYVCRKL